MIISKSETLSSGTSRNPRTIADLLASGSTLESLRGRTFVDSQRIAGINGTNQYALGEYNPITETVELHYTGQAESETVPSNRVLSHYEA